MLNCMVKLEIPENDSVLFGLVSHHGVLLHIPF